MKAILINSMIALFFFGGCSRAQPNENADANTLTNQAEHLVRSFSFVNNNHPEILASALNLLNQAIRKDPSFWPAYSEKLGIQTTLKQLDSACVTAKQLVVLRPKDDFFSYLAGEAFERNGDTTTAWNYYKKALVLNSSLLDTMKTTNDKFRIEKESRATILILLNQPEKAHEIYQQLFDSEKIPWRKEHYEDLLYMDRHERVFGGTLESIIKRMDKEKKHKSNGQNSVSTFIKIYPDLGIVGTRMRLIKGGKDAKLIYNRQNHYGQNTVSTLSKTYPDLGIVGTMMRLIKGGKDAKPKYNWQNHHGQNTVSTLIKTYPDLGIVGTGTGIKQIKKIY